MNPENPRALPEGEFRGPAKLVGQYKRKLNETGIEWDDEESIRKNLEDALAIHMPMQSSSRTTSASSLLKAMSIVQYVLYLMQCIVQQDFCLDCNICLLPAVSGCVIFCDERCLARYHDICLREWLVSKKTLMIGNELVGKCIKCCDEIRVSQGFIE